MHCNIHQEAFRSRRQCVWMKNVQMRMRSECESSKALLNRHYRHAAYLLYSRWHFRGDLDALRLQELSGSSVLHATKMERMTSRRVSPGWQKNVDSMSSVADHVWIPESKVHGDVLGTFVRRARKPLEMVNATLYVLGCAWPCDECQREFIRQKKLCHLYVCSLRCWVSCLEKKGGCSL